MTWTNLPAAAVVAGLAGLAALLYALQQLRTRYRDLTVVTTLFWRQVVDEAPVRTLRERFRHPWAYVLVLAICSLLWVALAEPRFTSPADRTFYVFVLDGSAGMAEGRRFQDAVDALERAVARVPAGQRQVIWSGAEIRPLLNPGEHDQLLRTRLERRAPDAAPASVERLLRQLSTSREGSGPLSVVVFGDAPVRRQVLDLVPAAMHVSRASAASPLGGNAGITALGVSDAASGAWDSVDVFVGVQTTTDRAAGGASGLRIELDGRAIPEADATTAAIGGGQAFVIRDVPARGGLLTASLAGADALALDNTASIRLPAKPLVRVLVSPSVQPVIGPVLDADRGVVETSDRADVVIRRAGETIGGDVPALEFVAASAQPQAFLFTHPRDLDSGEVFTQAVADIGLTQIDAMSLAQSSGRPIEVSIAPGTRWRFSVWQELLSDDYNFTRSRAFPLFVAGSVRWLAGTRAWYAWAAAGQPLAPAAAGTRDRVLADNGRVLDPVGVDLVPARAGVLRVDGGGAPISISLLDADVTTGARDASLAPADLPRAAFASAANLWTWVVLLAIVLIGAEWYLFHVGRIP